MKGSQTLCMLSGALDHFLVNGVVISETQRWYELLSFGS